VVPKTVVNEVHNERVDAWELQEVNERGIPAMGASGHEAEVRGVGERQHA
jgi:hypothetical protein